MNSDTTATANNMIAHQTAIQPNKALTEDSETKTASDTNQQKTDDELKLANKSESETKQGAEDDEQNNESSNLSTAFTISFDDDTPSNSKKLFGIRDSIRKFAPPKPHTIEKPRPPKSDNQENSYMSIESAPGGCQSKQTFRRDIDNSCRSSGRKSDSSRHSNISESAAFLIDKMLNCKQGESLSSICLNSSEKGLKDKKNRFKGGAQIKKLAHSSGDILDDEVDFCEDKSDNGTYIVGTDPESDAARRKIDELFGVVKAAETSIKTAGRMDGSRKTHGTVSRASRQPEKEPPMSRERQEHINRLATGRHSSRSSSSSRQELVSTSHRPRSATRQFRNSSSDRTSKLPNSRHKRAASHSSRHSSNREASDGDTQSSRSSLHDTEVNNLEAQSITNPGMKFNRAFALRRARLGLGEPATTGRITSTPGANVQELDSQTSSPRRNIALRYGQSGSSSAPQNLNRSDGGRFSLRMRKHPVPNRLMLGGHDPSRSNQQGQIIDNYSNRLAGSNNISRPTHFPLASHQSPVHFASAIPYPSGDENEMTSPSRFRALSSNMNSSLRKEQQSEFEIDGWDYSNEKLSYSFGLESENYKSLKGDRACNSADRRGSSSQLGALDCLVISAISSLSVKIRSSVCDLMVEHAKRLPSENETRLIVEEILPQLTANLTRPKSPTSIEEIDQSLYFDLAQALKNLKKIEQMVDVMKQISKQIPDSPKSLAGHSKSPTNNRVKSNKRTTVTNEGSESNPNSETTSLSPV